MTIREMLQGANDFWRPNRYGLKPYLIRDGQRHPFAVICPGGAYSMVCSFVEGLPYAEALNAKGYHAFVVYYRVRKKARYPAPQDDLETALREILTRAEKWNIEERGWSLWGSSAGGHLAASFCLEKRSIPKPSALILSYPVITMGPESHGTTRMNLLGKHPDPALADRLSVERHITGDFPPTYVWNGSADDEVDPVNSRMLENSLERAAVPYRAEMFDGVGHGVGLAGGTNAEPWFERAVLFWEKHR